MTERRPLRIALLGCGEHSRRCHAAPLAHYVSEHPGEVQLVAACDLDRQRAEAVAEEFGFAAVFEDLREMVAQAGPDGVVCVTPVDRTVEIAAEVLSLGLPCVIEKPLGVSAAQARALADAAERTGTPHMVSMNRRHWPYLVRALEWIGDRPVRLIRAEMARHRRTEESFIWSTAIHAVDAMVHLAGPIAGHQMHVVAGGELTATWYSISLEFAAGCRGQLQIAPTCGRLEETYELLGEGWSVRATMRDENAFALQCRQGRKCVIDESFHEPARPWLGDGSYGEVCAFVGALRERRPFSPTVEDVLPATELCFELARLGE